MIVRLVPATVDRRHVLASLMQLYIHDFSEIDGADVDADGLYDYAYLDDGSYWTDPSRHPFFILVDGILGGFVLVNAHSVRGTPDVHCIAEFFVMRKYRRRGVGRQAAQAIFTALPGRWEVAEMKGNTAGQAFWRKIITERTRGSFTDDFVTNDEWEGPVQAFLAPPPPRSAIIGT